MSLFQMALAPQKPIKQPLQRQSVVIGASQPIESSTSNSNKPRLQRQSVVIGASSTETDQATHKPIKPPLQRQPCVVPSVPQTNDYLIGYVQGRTDLLHLMIAITRNTDKVNAENEELRSKVEAMELARRSETK